MSVGVDDDLIITFNINRTSFFYDLLPAFAIERMDKNFGSPYCVGGKVAGRRATLTTTDLLALTLYYLRTKGPVVHLHPLFGTV